MHCLQPVFNLPLIKIVKVRPKFANQQHQGKVETKMTRKNKKTGLLNPILPTHRQPNSVDFRWDEERYRCLSGSTYL